MVFDSGFLLGDGVWEGIRLHEGVLVFLEQHLAPLRSMNRRLAFGHGMPFCLGAPLARSEEHIAFATLLRHTPNWRRNVPRAAVSWRVSLNLRGLAALPVAF